MQKHHSYYTRSRSRSRSPLREDINIRLRELETSNTEYKSKIESLNKEIDRINNLVTSREKYHFEKQLSYTQKLIDNDIAISKYYNDVNNFTLEKERMHYREKDNLLAEIDVLRIKNNVLVEENAKLTRQRDSELMKQIVAQRVQALDIMVFEMKAKEKNLILEKDNKIKEYETTIKNLQLEIIKNN